MRRRKRNWFNKLFWWLSGGGKGNDGEKKEKSKPSEKEKDTPKEKEEKPVEEKKTGEEIKPEEEPKKPILKPKILEEKPSKEDPPPYTPPIKHIPHVEEDPEEIEIEAHKVKEDPFSGRKILPVGIKSGKLNVPDSEVKNCSKIYLEVFNTITSMIYTLDHRNDNKVMRGLRHSYTNGYDFTGSNSYEEAREIYRKGYTKILPEVREKVKSLVVKYNNDNTNKSSINNDVVGYVPNVPNALMNLPSSMIHRKPCPRRTKTLHIIYFMEGNCGVPAGVFKKSGIVLLAAIQIIEKRKIDVMLEVGFCGGYGNTEVLGGVVKVKNYQEKLNIQKLCFPIAHPDFRIIAAGNTFGTGADNTYTGRYCLDGASLDRFSVIEINYSPAIETFITNSNQDLMVFCRKFREITKRSGIDCLFSYRALTAITKLEGSLGLREIFKICVTKGIKGDDLKTIQGELQKEKFEGNKYVNSFLELK